MKRKSFSKVVLIYFSIALISLMLTSTVFAAPLVKDPAKGYATKLPTKSGVGVLTFEDFEKSVKDGDGLVGKFAGTVPDDSNIPPATIEVVKGVSHSGTHSLKVSKRGLSALGEPRGYNTVSYKDIGIDIAGAFVKDLNNKNKTDTYFISAWIKNVDPKVTQYFWLQLQYGGSAEVWLPGQTYFEVKGSDWTQIGIAVVNGKTYYVPFIEDSTKSGIYPPRSGLSSWSALKFITKDPKKDPQDKNEPMIQTNDDFYVDDIIIWKVDNASQLVPTLPTEDVPTPTSAPTKPISQSSSSVEKSSTQTSDPSLEISNDISSEEESQDIESSIVESEEFSETQSEDNSVAISISQDPEKDDDEDKDGLGTGAIIGIIIGIVVLAGVGLGIYKSSMKKKE